MTTKWTEPRWCAFNTCDSTDVYACVCARVCVFFQGHGVGSHLYNSGLYDVEVHQLPAAQVAGAGPAEPESEEEAGPVQKQVQEQRWVWSLSDNGQPEADVG